MAVISGGGILILLLSLGLGWLFVRRALLPSVTGKLPPSGARPWSRFYVPSPDSVIPDTNAASAPQSEPSFWAYDAPGNYPPPTVVSDFPGGYPTTIVVNNAPGNYPPPTMVGDIPGGYPPPAMGGGISGNFPTGPHPARQVVESEATHVVFSDDGASAPVSADTGGFPPAGGGLNPGGDLLVFSSGGTPGSLLKRYNKKKTQGLITRAPYYSNMSIANDDEGII
jgi:hypothetical protein